MLAREALADLEINFPAHLNVIGLVVCDITIFIVIRYRYDSYNYMPIRYDIDNF